MREVIIFDMDGTLYDLNDVVQMSYDMQVDFLSFKKGISRDEAISFLAENHVYPVMKKDSKSATELFLQLGFDKKEWSDYRDKGFDVDRIDIKKAVDENTIAEFTKFATIVLLSSNAYPVIEKVLNHINISTSIFDDIICSDRFPYNMPFKKILAMEYISKKYGILYDNIYSIGDRYTTDIEPMLSLGGIGILLKTPDALKKVLIDIKKKKLKSCPLYTFYENFEHNR